MRHAIVAFVMLAVGCADVTEPYELDHARVIAVRTEPATLAPGEAGTVAVLVTGGDGPRVVPADGLAVTVPAPLAPYVAVTRGPDGWTVVAPTAAQLAGLRAALGVPATEPAAVPLTITTTVDGVALVAHKWTVVDATAPNPTIAGVALDGVVAPVLRAAAGSTPRLSVTHDAGPAAVVRWLSSVGELAQYQSADATLDAAAPARGAIVVVVRDARGGVAWQIVPAEVE
ncbi:MAG: hypothetical protein JNK64_16155 [Myxococcales bacterium]|nr:hypothetical protein [Myxococcales bacterium]